MAEREVTIKISAKNLTEAEFKKVRKRLASGSRRPSRRAPRPIKRRRVSGVTGVRRKSRYWTRSNLGRA